MRLPSAAGVLEALVLNLCCFSIAPECTSTFQAIAPESRSKRISLRLSVSDMEVQRHCRCKRSAKSARRPVLPISRRCSRWRTKLWALRSRCRYRPRAARATSANLRCVLLSNSKARQTLPFQNCRYAWCLFFLWSVLDVLPLEAIESRARAIGEWLWAGGECYRADECSPLRGLNTSVRRFAG